MQPLRRERLRRLVREQATDPQSRVVVVVEVVHHAEHSEQVSVRVISLLVEELTQGAAVVVGDALVGVQLHDPPGVEIAGSRKEPIPVGGVVPACVALTRTIRQQPTDQRVVPQDGPGVVGAAIVEGDDRVGEAAHRVEPARQIVTGVPDGQETNNRPGPTAGGASGTALARNGCSCSREPRRPAAAGARPSPGWWPP